MPNEELWAQDSEVHKKMPRPKVGLDPIRPHRAWNPSLVVDGYAVVTVQEILDIIRRNVPTDTHERAKSLSDEAILGRYAADELRNQILQIRVYLQGWQTHNAPLAGAIKQLLQEILDDTHYAKGRRPEDAKFNVNLLRLDSRIMFDPRNEVYTGRIHEHGR